MKHTVCRTLATYTTRLTVTDDRGGTSVKSATIQVAAAPLLVIIRVIAGPDAQLNPRGRQWTSRVRVTTTDGPLLPERRGDRVDGTGRYCRQFRIRDLTQIPTDTPRSASGAHLQLTVGDPTMLARPWQTGCSWRIRRVKSGLIHWVPAFWLSRSMSPTGRPAGCFCPICWKQNDPGCHQAGLCATPNNWEPGPPRLGNRGEQWSSIPVRHGLSSQIWRSVRNSGNERPLPRALSARIWDPDRGAQSSPAFCGTIDPPLNPPWDNAFKAFHGDGKNWRSTWNDPRALSGHFPGSDDALGAGLGAQSPPRDPGGTASASRPEAGRCCRCGHSPPRPSPPRERARGPGDTHTAGSFSGGFSLSAEARRSMRAGGSMQSLLAARRPLRRSLRWRRARRHATYTRNL